MFNVATFIQSRLKRFAAEEEGAITVDWVVITAGVVAFGLTVIATLGTAFAPNAQNLGTELQQYTIDTTFD